MNPCDMRTPTSLGPRATGRTLCPWGQQLTHHLHDTRVMAPLPGADRASRRSVSLDKTLSPTSILTPEANPHEEGWTAT
jgi:hypothetical protein